MEALSLLEAGLPLAEQKCVVCCTFISNQEEDVEPSLSQDKFSKRKDIFLDFCSDILSLEVEEDLTLCSECSTQFCAAMEVNSTVISMEARVRSLQLSIMVGLKTLQKNLSNLGSHLKKIEDSVKKSDKMNDSSTNVLKKNFSRNEKEKESGIFCFRNRILTVRSDLKTFQNGIGKRFSTNSSNKRGNETSFSDLPIKEEAEEMDNNENDNDVHFDNDDGCWNDPYPESILPFAISDEEEVTSRASQKNKFKRIILSSSDISDNENESTRKRKSSEKTSNSFPSKLVKTISNNGKGSSKTVSKQKANFSKKVLQKCKVKKRSRSPDEIDLLDVADEGGRSDSDFELEPSPNGIIGNNSQGSSPKSRFSKSNTKTKRRLIIKSDSSSEEEDNSQNRTNRKPISDDDDDGEVTNDQCLEEAPQTDSCSDKSIEEIELNETQGSNKSTSSKSKNLIRLNPLKKVDLASLSLSPFMKYTVDALLHQNIYLPASDDDEEEDDLGEDTPNSPEFYLRKLERVSRDYYMDYIPAPNNDVLGQIHLQGIEILINEEGRHALCSMCSYKFQIKMHPKKSNGQRRRRRCRVKDRLKKHIIGRHLNNIECSICKSADVPRELSQKRYDINTYKLHLLGHMNSHPYQCLCGKPFNDRGRPLKKHLWTHKSESEKEEAKRNGEVDPFEKNLQLHYDCGTCNKSFNDPRGLRRHHEESHLQPEEILRIICDLCGSQIRKRYLISHQKRFCPALVKERTKCHLCEVTFKHKSYLQRHMLRQHSKNTTDRPFLCSVCPKSFKVQGDLNLHIVACHREDRPFKCDTCGNSFAIRKNLKRHKCQAYAKEENEYEKDSVATDPTDPLA